MKYKIALITCYYGSFPWYFDFFIHTCKYNKSIDFYIITDSTYDKNIADNIHFIHLNWGDLNSFFSDKLDVRTDIREPYKLCDFKPAYGIIFSELIQNYDFWGHCDIDIIFGNIRNFITEEILDKYEVINVRHDILTGYFMLYKNQKKVNEIFKQSMDFEKVFEDNKHYCFDEVNFKFDSFKKGIHYSQIHSQIESMNHVVSRLSESNELAVFFDLFVVEGVPGRIKWDKGVLTYKDEIEVLLYHMVRFKRICKEGEGVFPTNVFFINEESITNHK